MNDWRQTRELSKFYRRMGSTSEPRRRPFLKSRLVGVVLQAEPFGVAGPTKIWARVENKSAEKETCAGRIAHEHVPNIPRNSNFITARTRWGSRLCA